MTPPRATTAPVRPDATQAALWVEHARGDHRGDERGPQRACVHCVPETPARA